MPKFIVQQGYDIKKGRAGDFQQWLIDNEEKLAAACPDGVEYLGTYANIFTSDRSGGAYRTLWGLDAYAGMDAFSGAMKQGGAFAELMDQAAAFGLDSADGGQWSNSLHRRVSDTAIWGEEEA